MLIRTRKMATWLHTLDGEQEERKQILSLAWTFLLEIGSHGRYLHIYRGISLFYTVRVGKDNIPLVTDLEDLLCLIHIPHVHQTTDACSVWGTLYALAGFVGWHFSVLRQCGISMYISRLLSFTQTGPWSKKVHDVSSSKRVSQKNPRNKYLHSSNLKI